MSRRHSRSVGMGIVALLGFALIWLDGSVARGGENGGIAWRSDLNGAKAEAKSKRRLLWIQFTGPWCHFCQLMDRESFIHPKVVGQSRDHFVPIKLQSDSHEELTTRLGIGGLPATVLVTPNGEVIAKHEGYVDGETFLAFLESGRARGEGAMLVKGTRTETESGPKPPAPVARRPEAEPEPAPVPVPVPELQLAMAGYCPVSLVQDHRLVPGESAVSLVHEGRIYRFANAIQRRTFLRQPERFVPVNSGRCPVTQVDQGDAAIGEARFGILYQGHLYLCSNELSRLRFMKNPDRYCHVDRADRELCSHCWGHDFVLAKGQTTWAPTHHDQLVPNFERVTREAARNSELTLRR